MKVPSYFGFFALLMLCVQVNAQFKLNGRIINYSGKEDLKINIPLVHGFHKLNSVSIPIDKDGRFSIILPVKETKFSNLIFQRKFHSLLLDPGKNISIAINEKDSTLQFTGGSSLAENKVMQAVDIEAYPFFLENNGDNQFATFTLEQLKSNVVIPYYKQRDNKIDLVMKSSIPESAKQLISLELKSIAYNYLNDLARTQISNRAKLDSLVQYVFDHSDPTMHLSAAGPQFYAFIDNYVRYLENKSLKIAKEKKISANDPLPYIGISLDSARKLEGTISKAQWRANIAAKNLQSNVVERYSYQQIVNSANYKELRQTEELANLFASRFPNSKFLPDISAKLSGLKSTLAENEKNKEIKIWDGYEQLTSIYDVIKQFKGKVVYLDIWGTWCGPCKMEIPYLPNLKEKFKNQDIVYVYLDLDEDKDDQMWREFIKVNGLTGVHIRKNRAAIAPIWKELLANAIDKAEYYPQYFIFDKEGKLAVTKALRPSNEDELYKQLAVYLK